MVLIQFGMSTAVCLIPVRLFTFINIHSSVFRYHGDRQGSVLEEDSFGEVGLSGDFGFWDSLLDVLYPAYSH